ncbi:CLIP domain-containing serine protease B4-like [Anopheles moucheti]|uniref:CLIP domain-containing serine protease B4-like n=1 Tax=Anopheles moucheti TaxID=186751 RepID=UPI0022F06141|nr:CLIP domain-containing serine protease B4-like [Anopheles moucheti]
MIRVRFSVFTVPSLLLLSLVALALGQQQVNQECIVTTGSPGRCIRLKDCAKIYEIWNRKIVFQSETDELTAVLSACGSDGDSLDPIVCCETPTLSPGRRTVVTATTRATTTAAPMPITIRPTPAQPTTISTRTTVRYDHYRDVLPPYCGQKSNLGFNIISDATDDNNVHVWAVLLEINKTDSKTPSRCAGTLIQERFVLTAAHCVFKLPKENIKLFFGVSKVSKLQQCLVLGECQERGAAEFIIHPEYNPHARANDIALIWLNNTVDLDSVVPACLPLNYTLDESVSHDTRVHSVGWGTNESGNWSDSKGVVLLNVKSQDLCGNFLRWKFPRFDPSMFYSVMCTVGNSEGQDVCRGDSGAPLLKFHEEKYYVVGVVGFGPKCSWLTDPSVSARVSEYLGWILLSLKRFQYLE